MKRVYCNKIKKIIIRIKMKNSNNKKIKYFNLIKIILFKGK